MEKTKEQKTILRAAVATAFITTFMGSALNLSVPNLEAQFQASGALIGWVVNSYTLAVAAMSVPMGKIADISGKRKVFLLGILFFAIFSVACGFAMTIWTLIFFRILQGIAAAMIFATNNAILISAFPDSQRGRVIGVSTAGVYIGLSVGPVIGGFLNHYINWQSIFISSALVAVVSLVLAAKGVPKGEERIPSKMDVPGNLLYMLSIVVALYGLSNLSALKYGWAILLLGILLGVAFIVVERKAENPIVRISMFSKDPAFTLSNLAALLNYGATFAISYLMSIYLQVIQGYSSQTAGLILIAQPIVQALFSPMMGKLSDRVAPHKLASGGMAICAAGLAVFAFISINTPLWLIIATLMVSGFGFALFSSPNTNAIMACVEKKDYSIANSMVATMRTVGQAGSMGIVTVVVGFVLGNTALNNAAPEQLIRTLHILFGIFVVLCILGVFMSLKRGEKK